MAVRADRSASQHRRWEAVPPERRRAIHAPATAAAAERRRRANALLTLVESGDLARVIEQLSPGGRS